MNMVEKTKTPKKSRTGIPKRNKQSYAQYVWIRNMFLRLDEIDTRLDNIVAFLKTLGYDDRKVNKGESEQSNERNTP